MPQAPWTGSTARPACRPPPTAARWAACGPRGSCSSTLTSLRVISHAAEHGAERHVLGVAPGADAHQAVDRRHAGRVEQHPAATQPGLEDGVEVLRRLVEPHVAGHQARRDVQRPAERDAQVREVAADAGALREHLLRGGGRRGAARPVGDVRVDPVDDRAARAPMPGRQLAERLARERRTAGPIRSSAWASGSAISASGTWLTGTSGRSASIGLASAPATSAL